MRWRKSDCCFKIVSELIALLMDNEILLESQIAVKYPQWSYAKIDGLID
jgi:hypothetical protein